jgi:hypothetical protein
MNSMHIRCQKKGMSERSPSPSSSRFTRHIANVRDRGTFDGSSVLSQLQACTLILQTPPQLVRAKGSGQDTVVLDRIACNGCGQVDASRAHSSALDGPGRALAQVPSCTHPHSSNSALLDCACLVLGVFILDFHVLCHALALRGTMRETRLFLILAVLHACARSVLTQQV